jgi:hypothetical protein
MGAPTDPAGVPAESELVDCETVPENVGALLVPVGVILSDPPVVPISMLAANVPIIVKPSIAATSVYVAGQDPEMRIKIDPDGTPVDAGLTCAQAVPLHPQ